MNAPQNALTRINARTAIALVNFGQMETRAWRHIFEKDSFSRDHQIISTIVAAQDWSHEGTQLSKETVAAIQLYLSWESPSTLPARGTAVERATELVKDKKAPSSGTVMDRLRDLESESILRQVRNETQRNVQNWTLGPGVAEKLNKLQELLVIIHKVVALQMAHPNDPEIGSDLLPSGVYYNIVANRQAHLNREFKQ